MPFPEQPNDDDGAIRAHDEQVTVTVQQATPYLQVYAVEYQAPTATSYALDAIASSTGTSGAVDGMQSGARTIHFAPELVVGFAVRRYGRSGHRVHHATGRLR